MGLIGKVGATFEMIKVVVREIQSALRAFSDIGRIEKTGFRTL